MPKNPKKSPKDPLAEIVQLANEIEAENQELEQQARHSIASLKEKLKRTTGALEGVEKDFKNMEAETQRQFENALLEFLEIKEVEKAKTEKENIS